MARVEIPDIPARQLVFWTLGATAVIGGFWLLIRFQYVIPMLLAAFILSTAVRPGVDWLEERGITKPVGVLLIFGVIGVLFALLILFSIPVLGEQGSAISESLAEGYAQLHAGLEQWPNIIVQRLLLILPDDLTAWLPEAGGAANIDADMPVPAVEGQGEQLINGLFQIIAIVILTFYWVLEGDYIKHSIFLLIPMQKRISARQMIGQMEAKVSSYLLGQGVLCLVIGGLAFIAYTLIGLPNALLLAIFAGLLEAVPIVGPFLGAVPAIVIGLSISPATALWVVLATAVIQQLENSFLVPRIMKQAIGIRPLVTLMALLAFGSLFGVLGALIALPLAAVMQLLVDRYLLAQESLELTQPGRDQLSVLRYETNQLVQDVRSQVRDKESVPSAATDALEDELEAIALDLESHLAARGEGA